VTDHRRKALAHVIELFRRSRLVQLWAPVFIWMGAIPSTGSGRSFCFSQELAPGWDFELADIGYNLAGIIAALGLIWLIERG
jgi:hypothetical protein